MTACACHPNDPPKKLVTLLWRTTDSDSLHQWFAPMAEPTEDGFVLHYAPAPDEPITDEHGHEYDSDLLTLLEGVAA